MELNYPGVILITGASGGLGSRVVDGFLRAGFTNIACQYRNRSEELSRVFTNLEKDSTHHLFRAELTDEKQVADLRKSVEDTLGPVWGVVNLAGASTNSVCWKLSLVDFNRIIADNLSSTFLVTREFLPGMRERQGGRIVNTSSVVAHTGVIGASHYCAAKAGIEGFTRAVATEAASKNVTVNSIALGYFDAGIIAEVPADMLEVTKSRIPVKRLGRAEAEIFPLIAYLMSKDAEFMTGQVLHLNGGQY